MKFWESNHQSVQEGDMQFIALYKFYYQDLYAYGVSLGFNTEDVKDAIQEVYLKLYFNERLCIDEKKIKFYLLRSVRNQLIEMLLHFYNKMFATLLYSFFVLRHFQTYIPHHMKISSQ